MSKKTSIGGQALMEGIMMVGPNKKVAAFCDKNGNITTEEIVCPALKDKYPILGKPFIRGIFSMAHSLNMGMKAMERSADKAMEGEEVTESKFDKWVTEKMGDKMSGVITAVGSVLGILLSVLLFMYLPSLITNGIKYFAGEGIEAFRSLIEGGLRMVIFLIYILLISLMPDIKRVFMYHGAEHKTIFCYEAELPLTVENVKKQSRFHPRCGTSFMTLIILIGIIVGFLIPFQDPLLRTLMKILTLPVVISVGYELIKFCGKHDGILCRIISYPGLLIQRITTKEPDDKMIETAIAAMVEVIPENGEDII